ncbi:helix-turn-helix domain-containing protein, partial [Thiocystis violacea]|uniref:helix-turn-helix domain-containing protein n=1 Tax=Thiocystis violacea TaxID=13725 RepID=UPI00190620C8
MPRCTPIPVSLTDKERTQLETLVRQHTTAQQLAIRARIILAADAGKGMHETAATLQVSRSLVQRWRERADQPVLERLSDCPRSGTPPTFTPEQICAIIALACEPAVREGVTLARWTMAVKVTIRDRSSDAVPPASGRASWAVDAVRASARRTDAAFSDHGCALEA